MKNTPHMLGRAAVLSLVLGMGPVTWAQGTSANPVLKSAQVTEDASVDALAIDQPEVVGGVTRGFRPATRSPVKAGAGKASLRITFGTDSADS